ncbi:MAG: hydrogenase nickel incorporation protein HypB, partial [Solirubrobacteraceae bacterium]
NMVRSALPAVPLDEIDLLLVENVGNLVCPAEFRIGEDAKIMVCSVTEGEDKPLKYPLMFRSCELVIINKVDLLAYLDFDVDRLEANVLQVNPHATVMRVSAKTGAGVDAFRGWLKELPARVAGEAHDHHHAHDHDHDHDHHDTSTHRREAHGVTGQVGQTTG